MVRVHSDWLNRWESEGGSVYGPSEAYASCKVTEESDSHKQGLSMSNLDSIMVKAIAQAARNTRRVCGREHIKGTTRHDRVSEFVTQLRRAIGHQIPNSGKDFVEKITDRRYWYDAGQTDTNENFYAIVGLTNITSQMLAGWCYNAVGSICESSLSEEIEDDLEQLKADLGFLHMKTEEVDRLNQQADQVADNLLRVVEPLTL